MPEQPVRAIAKITASTKRRIIPRPSRLFSAARDVSGFWRTLIAPVLRRAGRQGIVAAGRRILRDITAHRAHVSGDLPNLSVGDFVAERRHAVWPPIADGGDDVIDLAAVDPFVVHQSRTGAATAV